MKIIVSLLSIASMFLTGFSTCAQSYLSTSSDFDRHHALMLLTLPVETYGNPIIHSLPNFSDNFATPFLEAGFKIIDRSATPSEASRLGLDLDKRIEEKNVANLASALHVDAVFLSSVAYTFVPAESGVIPSSYSNVADSTGKGREISAKGPEEYNRGERYVMTSLSARLIDVKNMTTLLSAYVEPCGQSLNFILVNMLREKLSGKD